MLRRSLREGDTLEQALERRRLGSPGVAVSMLRPGRQHWQQLVAANNQQPPMDLRVNRASIAATISAPAGERDRSHVPANSAPEGIRLARPVDVKSAARFHAGDVSVQDEAAQPLRCCWTLQPGERVLDACAAPGGKACHMLERQPTLGELVAMDGTPNRLATGEDNLARLQLTATLRSDADAASLSGALRRPAFDRILVDAPCSGSGVIRRHPDIKLLRRADDIAALATSSKRFSPVCGRC